MPTSLRWAPIWSRSTWPHRLVGSMPFKGSSPSSCPP
ncbi:hypothetical protein EVA_14673 [gut metagenome]|uniref:Uncharacterized protein n=1 Tax=gut metagenome TaxID=749906 RepID=J9GCV0_9ZZZZ